ncbi:MAG: hypothetical protein JXR91_12155 [Deltaproteobacteria bacterium]|nr:hypothetical protein [Deltaproteobacteria bacterium]
MNNFKKCPDCNKELPITASNCKFCGASLSNNGGSSFFSEMENNKPSIPKPPSINRPAIPSIPKVSPPLSVTAETVDENWIPDSESSELIDLENISGAGHKDKDNTPVSTGSDMMRDAPASHDNEKTTVMQMPAEYLAGMASENQESGELPLIGGDSGLINLDEIEPVDEIEAIDDEISIMEELPIEFDEISEPDEPDEPDKIDVIEEQNNIKEPSPPVAMAVLKPATPAAPNTPRAPALSFPQPGQAPVPSLPRTSTVPAAPLLQNPAVSGNLPSPKRTMLGIPAIVPPPQQAQSDSDPLLDEAWIPDADNSELIDLDEHSTRPVVSEIIEHTPIKSEPPAPLRADSVFSSDESDESDERTAKIDPDEIRKKYDNTTPQNKVLKTWNKLDNNKKMLILGGSAFILTLLIAGLIIIPVGEQDVQVVTPKEVVTTNTTEKVKTPAPEKTEKTIEKSLEEVKDSVPAAGKKCKDISTLGSDFPWISILKKIADGGDSKNICGLLGTSASSISKMFATSQLVGPDGYDWIKDANKLDMFPGGKPDGRAPVINFFFTNDHLYNITMQFRNDADAASINEAFLSGFFTKVKTTEAGHDKVITEYLDGDLKINLIIQQWYGQTYKTITFNSVQIDKYLGNQLETIETVKEVYASAEKEYFAWNFDSALEIYKKVISLNPSIGSAYTKQALIYLRKDDFGKASQLAAAALEKSRNNKAKAEAKTILATVALKNDSTESALAFLNEALALDPGNINSKKNIERLKNADYDSTHLAQTAARLACVENGSNSASKESILARGFFPDMGTYNKAVKKIKRSRNFKKAKQSYMKWECR